MKKSRTRRTSAPSEHIEHVILGSKSDSARNRVLKAARALIKSQASAIAFLKRAVLAKSGFESAIELTKVPHAEQELLFPYARKVKTRELKRDASGRWSGRGSLHATSPDQLRN